MIIIINLFITQPYFYKQKQLKMDSFMFYNCLMQISFTVVHGVVVLFLTKAVKYTVLYLLSFCLIFFLLQINTYEEKNECKNT